MSDWQWDRYFMNMANLVASKSKDRSIQCGVVFVGEDNVILSTGYNGFPRGIDDDKDEYHERPEKYAWTEHAERNGIYNAARVGTRLKDSKAYITAHPCVDCVRALIQVGVKEIYIPHPSKDPFTTKGRKADWEESFKKADEMLNMAGVKVTYEI